MLGIFADSWELMMAGFERCKLTSCEKAENNEDIWIYLQDIFGKMYSCKIEKENAWLNGTLVELGWTPPTVRSKEEE